MYIYLSIYLYIYIYEQISKSEYNYPPSPSQPLPLSSLQVCGESETRRGIWSESRWHHRQPIHHPRGWGVLAPGRQGFESYKSADHSTAEPLGPESAHAAAGQDEKIPFFLLWVSYPYNEMLKQNGVMVLWGRGWREVTGKYKWL